jgi:hypothetical protein
MGGSAFETVPVVSSLAALVLGPAMPGRAMIAASPTIAIVSTQSRRARFEQ